MGPFILLEQLQEAPNGHRLGWSIPEFFIHWHAIVERKGKTHLWRHFLL